MSRKDVLKFAKENPQCAFASADGDQPRVRMFLSVFFDDDKIYFTTGAGKSVYKQLSKNPKVELCYLSKDFRMMRITGRVEAVDDRKKKQRLIEEKDYLKGFAADDPDFILLRLTDGKARFWTIENNLSEDGLELIDI